MQSEYGQSHIDTVDESGRDSYTITTDKARLDVDDRDPLANVVLPDEDEDA